MSENLNDYKLFEDKTFRIQNSSETTDIAYYTYKLGHHAIFTPIIDPNSGEVINGSYKWENTELENSTEINLKKGNDIYIVDNEDYKQIIEYKENGIDSVFSYVDYDLPNVIIITSDDASIIDIYKPEIENLILLEDKPNYKENYINSILSDGTEVKIYGHPNHYNLNRFQGITGKTVTSNQIFYNGFYPVYDIQGTCIGVSLANAKILENPNFIEELEGQKVGLKDFNKTNQLLESWLIQKTSNLSNGMNLIPNQSEKKYIEENPDQFLQIPNVTGSPINFLNHIMNPNYLFTGDTESFIKFNHNINFHLGGLNAEKEIFPFVNSVLNNPSFIAYPYSFKEPQATYAFLEKIGINNSNVKENLDLNKIAEFVKKGHSVNLILSLDKLLFPLEEHTSLNHAITVTGVIEGKDGIEGFYICDPGVKNLSRMVSFKTLEAAFTEKLIEPTVEQMLETRAYKDRKGYTPYAVISEEPVKQILDKNIDGEGNYFNNIIIGNSGMNTLKGIGGNNLILGGDGIDTLHGSTFIKGTEVDLWGTYDLLNSKANKLFTSIEDFQNNDTNNFDTLSKNIHEILGKDKVQFNYLSGGSDSSPDTYYAGAGNNIMVDEGNLSVDFYNFNTSITKSGKTFIVDKDKWGCINIDGKTLYGGAKLKDPTKQGYFVDAKVSGVTYKVINNNLNIFVKKGDDCDFTIIVNGFNGYEAKTLSIELDNSKYQEEPTLTLYGLIETFEFAFIAHDPLILDLSGDGITTTTVENGVYFDMDADGFAELTAWAGYGDGLLAIDLNENGIIDNGRELFGDQTLLPNGKLAQNGFEALAQYDENNDYVIDSSNTAFSNLAA